MHPVINTYKRRIKKGIEQPNAAITGAVEPGIEIRDSIRQELGVQREKTAQQVMWHNCLYGLVSAWQQLRIFV